jgi:uncharacterized protein YbjT (DUF2867 family)
MSSWIAGVMERIPVVGATGQLGRAAIRKLKAREAHVRALVRSADSAAYFESLGVEPLLGDLTDLPSLTRACTGVTCIVATANAAIPSRSTDTFEAVERDGYRNLIQAAIGARLRRFVHTSVPLSKYEHLSPFLQFKRETERALVESGLDHVILRADIFMDVSFTMMGSTIPLRGTEGATVLRPFAFSNRYFSAIKDSIEKKHVARIPGDGNARHAFICVNDVAEFLASAAFSGPSGSHVVGGPEALTFVDVVRIYERVLGVTLQTRRTPAAVFRCVAPLSRPFSPAGANLFCLNYLAAKEDTFPDPAVATAFSVQLTTAEAFLRRKMAMAAAA